MAIRVLDFAEKVEENRQRLIQHCRDESIEVDDNASLDDVVDADLRIATPGDPGLATATADDVMHGKTFYGGSDWSLRTGTNTAADPAVQNILFTFKNGVATTDPENRLVYNLPLTTEWYRDYLFYNNPNYVDFTVGDTNALKSIGGYVFSGCKQFRFFGLEKLSQLEDIGARAFSECQISDFLSKMPSNLKYIRSNAFYNGPKDGCSIIVPDSVLEIDSYAFASYAGVVQCDQFYLPQSFPKTTLPTYMLYYLSFDCDFVCPTPTTQFGSSFVRCGTFNNITVGPNVVRFGDYTFGSYDSDPVSRYRMKTATFQSIAPPTFGNVPFANQLLQTPYFKIYVPDESVQLYKSAQYFDRYADRIFPISEKPIDTAKSGDPYDTHFTVNLELNGGSTEQGTLIQQYGVNWHDLPIPTRAGYTFEGWYTEQGHKRSNGDPCCNVESMTLFAKWEEEDMIIMDPAGGELSSRIVNVAHNTPWTSVTLPEPSLSGWTFNGWDGKGTSLWVEGVVGLFAGWTKNA